MAYPVLHNARETVANLRDGQRPELETGRRHSRVDVEERHFRILRSLLGDVRRHVDGQGGDRTEFDSAAAVHLHENLPISRSIAADPDFWAYLSVVEFPELVQWRWGTDATDGWPPANRYLGRWKDTFCRLWFRAELARTDGGSEEPYRFVSVGGEDFWVGILERQFSECNNVISALLRFWSEMEAEGEASMADHRAFFRVIRLLRPSRAYETLSPSECHSLFERAFALSKEAWIREL